MCLPACLPGWLGARVRLPMRTGRPRRRVFECPASPTAGVDNAPSLRAKVNVASLAAERRATSLTSLRGFFSFALLPLVMSKCFCNIGGDLFGYSDVASWHS